MKDRIYDRFELEDQVRSNKNLHTEIIKGTKSKPKIKRIKTTLKPNIYNQFQLKGTIATNQNLHWKNSNKSEIKGPGTKIKLSQTIRTEITNHERKGEKLKPIHQSFTGNHNQTRVALGGRWHVGAPWDMAEAGFWLSKWCVLSIESSIVS